MEGDPQQLRFTLQELSRATAILSKIESKTGYTLFEVYHSMQIVACMKPRVYRVCRDLEVKHQLLDGVNKVSEPL